MFGLVDVNWEYVARLISVVFLFGIFFCGLYSYLVYHLFYRWSALAMIFIFGFRAFVVYLADAMGWSWLSFIFNSPYANTVEFGLGFTLMVLDFYVINKNAKVIEEETDSELLAEFLEEDQERTRREQA